MILFYAATLLLVCVPLHLVGLRPLPRAAALTSSADPAQQNPPEPLVPPSAETLAMALFATVLTAHGFVVNALSVHVLTLFKDLGLHEQMAVFAGALIGPAQVGARLMELLFGKRLSAVGLGLVATILLPIAFFIPLSFGANLPSAIAFGLIYGASNGLVTIARGVVPHALFGPIGYGRRLGVIAAPTWVVKAASPAIFAWFLLHFGPIDAMIGSTILGLCAALAMLALARLVKSKAA